MHTAIQGALTTPDETLDTPGAKARQTALRLTPDRGTEKTALPIVVASEGGKHDQF